MIWLYTLFDAILCAVLALGLGWLTNASPPETTIFALILFASRPKI